MYRVDGSIDLINEWIFLQAVNQAQDAVAEV